MRAAVPERAAEWMSVWPAAERAVHRSVRGRLPAGVEPQDVSQQVFVDLLRAGDHAPPPERLRFWAVAVGRRVVADLYRRKSLRPEDLAQAPVVDIESIALARLRCEVAAEVYASMPPADRRALADRGEGSSPIANKTKLRRSRARRTLREKAERLVGAGLALPRLGWVAGATGAAAVALPLCLGLGGPGMDTTPDTPHGTSAIVVPTGRPAGLGSAGSAGLTAGGSAPARAKSPAAAVAPEGPTYHRRVKVSVPVAGPAGYDHFTPADSAGPPPAACAENLQVSDHLCVDHPLR